MYEPKLVLITLLIKLGVAAAVSAVTARALTFQRLLFAERRTNGQTIELLAFLCIPLTLGVWIRFIVLNFYAADIGFETVIIPEMNLGQLCTMIRAKYLIDAVPFSKVKGRPFQIREIVGKVEEYL